MSAVTERKLRTVAALLVVTLAACQAIAPALTQLGLAFGQDLIGATSVNYTPRYATQVEQLLVALAREMSGMQFQAQLAAQGYVAPPPRYLQPPGYGQQPAYGQTAYGQTAYGQPAYPTPSPYETAATPPYASADPNNPYGQPATNPYGQPPPVDPYGQQAATNPYGQPAPVDPYGQQAAANPYDQAPPVDPYGQQAAASPYGQPPPVDPYGQPAPVDPYGQPAPVDPYGQQAATNPYGQPAPVDPYGQQAAANPYGQPPPVDAYGQPAPVDPYGQQAAANPYAQPAPVDPYAQQAAASPYAQPQPSQPYPYATRSIRPIVASVDLLVARANAGAGTPLETIADGAVLRDGRGNPAAGDKLKVRFNVNCACFVYVIGIDATGYVARIFPDPGSPITNPIAAGQEYIVPGEGEWWGLDDQRGVEQIYVIASYVARDDVEQALAALESQPRTPVSNYRGVAEPVELPSTRGLVKVKDAPPVSVTTSTGSTGQFTPTSFLGRSEDVGVVVTRWFRHE